MRLTELFNQVQPWHWLAVGKSTYETGNGDREQHGDAALFKYAAKFDVPSFPHPYYVCFEPYEDLGENGYSMYFCYFEKDNDRSRTFPERTGTGFAVYSTIADIIDAFIKKTHAKALRMSGQVGKQTDIYEKLCRKLLPRLPGWTVERNYYGTILHSQDAVMESFDGVQNWRWTDKDAGLWTAMFMINDLPYMVNFGGSQSISVTFSAITKDKGASTAILGTGGAPRVFATVLAIIADFMRQRKPRALSFAAKKHHTSRVSLYRRMCKALAPQLPGYELTEEDEDNPHSDAVYFTFELEWH